MPKFHYKAVRGDGEEFEGTVDVADRFAVYGEVRSEGGTVLSIEERATGFNLDVRKVTGFLGAVHTGDKIIFARNVAAMITAGLSLSRSLAVLERQSKNKKLKEVIAALGEDIKKWKSLHEAMERFPKVFSKLFTAMVKAGEESGKLANSFVVVADQVESSYNLTKKVRGAMMYPGIILSAMVLIDIGMLIYVVPTLTA